MQSLLESLLSKERDYQKGMILRLAIFTVGFVDIVVDLNPFITKDSKYLALSNRTDWFLVSIQTIPQFRFALPE